MHCLEISLAAVVFIAVISGGDTKFLRPYRVMDGIVNSCPTNLAEITNASTRLECNRDKFGNDQYICVPNSEKSALMELCHHGIMEIVNTGHCLEINERSIEARDCTGFADGCPDDDFNMDEMYKYPACLRINAEANCYLADPSCPNLTRQFTTDNTWGNSTANFVSSFEFSNTTERGVYTTLPTNEGSVREIVGGIAPAIVVLVVPAIVILVWKKRKKHRKRAGKHKESNEQLAFL